MDVKWEILEKCPVCGSDTWDEVLKTGDRLNIDSNEIEFRLTQCPGCGIVLENPRVDVQNIDAFYPSQDYDPYLNLKKRKEIIQKLYFILRPFTMTWKRQQINRQVKQGRLLDYGCGTGEFLNEMNQNGWKCVGIERDPYAVDYAQKESKLAVYRTEEEAKPEDQLYNVITFWHSLEHLYDPQDVLIRMKEWLHPDGMIFIAAPNWRSFDAKIYGRFWSAYDLPRHIWHFDPNSIQNFARQAGLDVIAKKQMPLDAYYHSLLSEKWIQVHRDLPGWLLPAMSVRGMLVATISKLSGMFQHGSGMLYMLRNRQ